MTTQIELAYQALHAVLQAMASGSDGCPDTVSRNRSMTDLLASSRTGVQAYLNLLDETGRLLGESVAGEDDLAEFEILQPAILEIVVVDPGDAARDVRFDGIMEALKDLFQTLDDTLGGLVDYVRVTEPPRRMVLRGDIGVKAASVKIDMLFTVPTVFG